MKYLLVVFFLFDGQWVEGDPAEGWGPYPYQTESACLIAKLRAEEIFTRLRLVNPRAIEKRFECTAEQIEAND